MVEYLLLIENSLFELTRKGSGRLVYQLERMNNALNAFPQKARNAQRNLWGARDSECPSNIFFPPKNRFLATELKSGK